MAVVRKLEVKDFGQAVEILVSSFIADSYQIGLLPDDGKQAKRLERYFSGLLGTALSPDSPYLVEIAALDDSDTADAVAIWMKPEATGNLAGKHSPQLRELWRYSRVFGSKTLNALRTDRSCMKALPNYPTWYLNYLGTRPAAQGRGAGSALLQQRLQDADAAGIAAYLESSSKSNIRYYERFGFEVLAELPKFSTVALTTMVKQPQSRAA